MDSQKSTNSNSDIFQDFEMSLEELYDLRENYEEVRSAFETSLATIAIENIENCVFKEQMPKLKSVCDMALNKIKETMDTNNSDNDTVSRVKNILEVYSNLIDVSLTAVAYVQEKILFVNVLSLPIAISEILLSTFSHCKESESIYGQFFELLSELLSTLFKKARELQTALLNLLNNYLVYDLQNDNELETLVDVAHIIPRIGEIVTDLDLKTSAEIWKGYITLVSVHCEHLKTRMDIDGPLKYLSSAIIQNIEIVVLQNDTKTTEKLLKLSNFYLKILIKLCELYLDVIVEMKLFDLLITLNQYSFSYLYWNNFEEKLIESIQTYLSTGAEPLLNILVNNRVFARYYFKNITEYIHNDDRRLGAIFLSASILKKTMYEDEETNSMWFSTDCNSNIIYTLFSFLDECHVEFSSEIPVIIPVLPGSPKRIGSLYEYLLMHIGSAVVNLEDAHSKNLQELMIQNILQPNVWRALFSIDLWCIMARYGSEEFCYGQLLFLVQVYSDLRRYKHKIEVKYLCNLIYRLYKLLSTNNILTIARDFPCVEHSYLWIIIGLDNHPECNIADTVCNFVLHQSDLVLQNCNDIEEYLKLRDGLELLSTYTFPEAITDTIKNLLPTIIKLWSLNFQYIKQKNELTSFLNVLCKITASLVIYLNNEDIYKILYTLHTLNITNITVNLSILIILKSLGKKHIENTLNQKQIFELIKSLFSILLNDTNSLVHQEALEAFSFFAYNTQHESIIKNTVGSDDKIRQAFSKFLRKTTNIQSTKEFLKKQRQDLITHKCIKTSTNISEPVQKKPKFVKDVDIIGLIQRLKFDCKVLVEYCEDEPLAQEIKADLLPTVSKLLPLLEK